MFILGFWTCLLGNYSTRQFWLLFSVGNSSTFVYLHLSIGISKFQKERTFIFNIPGMFRGHPSWANLTKKKHDAIRPLLLAQAAVAAHLALERNMVPLDDWIGTYPIFLQVLLNIQDATPLKPGCNTTKTGMQHHKQRHKEGIIDVFFFWNCETHGGGRYVRKDHGSHQHWINVSNHLSEVPCGQRANKCILGSEIHTYSHYIRFSSSILSPYNHCWLYLHFPSLWWSHPHFSYSNSFFS